MTITQKTIKGYEMMPTSVERGWMMSNFNCDKCGVLCADSTSGCEHYPPEIKPMRGFGMQFDIKTGMSREWFVDKYGTKRWSDNDKPCDT